MSFSIESYDRGYLDGMTALYNAETTFEPYIAPLDPERFIALVELKSYFDPAGLLVAREGGEVIGWIHACAAAGSEPGHDPQQRVPRIRMLVFPRHRLKVGAALAAEATAWLWQASATASALPAVSAAVSNLDVSPGPSPVRSMEAMHARWGYPFYRGLWLGGEPMGPASMPHIQLAFEVAGYKNTQESVFMVTEMDSPPNERPAGTTIELVETAAEMRHEPMRESWIGFEPRRIQAFAGGEEAGSIGWVLQPHVAERLGAPCVNIWSLGVRQPFRRLGIATALLARALTQGYRVGARSASVSTQLWNGPAHATYAQLGFRPHCILVGRLLQLTAAGNDEAAQR